MEQPNEQHSFSNQGLICRAPGRLLFCIPNCAVGQESQFPEFPRKCLLGLSTNKKNILAMCPVFSGVMSPCDLFSINNVFLLILNFVNIRKQHCNIPLELIYEK